MSQIEITILKQGNRYKNVISIAFFTMKNSYRPIDFYKTKLKTFIQRKKVLTGFETRIYTDNSGKDIALEVADEDTTVMHYDCPPFREGDGHTGTFGTIVRFLPLFEKDLDTVWISDIDIHPSFLDMNILKIMEKNDTDVFIDSALCYDRKPWARVKHPIVAHRFISKVKFPKQIFTNFMKGLIDGKYSDLINEINAYNSRNDRKTPNDKFPYGMDEVFINGPVYNSIKRNNLKIVIRKDFFIQKFLEYSFEGFREKYSDILTTQYRNPNPESFKKTKEIYKKYIPMLVDKYPCMQELLDHMPDFRNTFEIYLLADSKDL